MKRNVHQSWKMKITLVVIVLLPGIFSVAQSNYDACSDALLLCSNKAEFVTNVGATAATYPNGEDDFNFCFQPRKTSWLKLETNDLGGDLEIHLNQLQFFTGAGSALNFNLLRANFPCDGSTYMNDTCIVNITNNQVVQIPNLLANTTYFICLSGADVGGIASEFEAMISIDGVSVDRPLSTISIWTPTDTICEGEAIHLYAFLNNCPDFTEYRWYKNNELFAVSDSSFIVTANVQTGDVFSVENNCYTSCTDTIKSYSNSIVVNQVDFLFSGDTTVAFGQPAYLNCYSSVDSIFWTPSFLVQFADSSQAIAFPEETTTFYAKAYKDGCFATQAIEVTVRDDLKIFNTFSPNDDGVNERWIIKGIEKYPDAEVSIFTRWGQRVFFATNYKASNAWDGTKEGKALQAGTYFYVIDLKEADSSRLIKGSINLIK